VSDSDYTLSRHRRGRRDGSSDQPTCCASAQSYHLTERKAISERTEAVPAAREREAIGHAPDPAGAVERMRAARKAQAGLFAANVLPTIPEVQAAGYTSFNAIAGQLNARRSLATGCQDFGSPFVSNHVSVLRKWAEGVDAFLNKRAPQWAQN
jgi:hypothetical protein